MALASFCRLRHSAADSAGNSNTWCGNAGRSECAYSNVVLQDCLLQPLSQEHWCCRMFRIQALQRIELVEAATRDAASPTTDVDGATCPASCCAMHFADPMVDCSVYSSNHAWQQARNDASSAFDASSRKLCSPLSCDFSSRSRVRVPSLSSCVYSLRMAYLILLPQIGQLTYDPRRWVPGKVLPFLFCFFEFRKA